MFANRVSEGDRFAEKFEILSLIGSGNCGTVFKAKHLVLNSHVALKILEIDTSNHPHFTEQFQRNASEAFSVSHKNLARVFDVGVTEDKVPYLTMEFLDGISLAEYLRVKQVLPWNVCRTILQQILDGLEHAHSRNVFHLNLKPSNIILVDGNINDVRITDIGLARIFAESSSGGTGTFYPDDSESSCYACPERAKSPGQDRRCDIYSVGAILFEMLTGVPPHSERGSSGESLSNAAPHLHYPKKLEMIIAKMLAANPEHRYASITDLNSDLIKYQQSGDEIIAASSSFKNKVIPALVAFLIVCSVAGVVPFVFNSQFKASTENPVPVKKSIDEINSDRSRADFEALSLPDSMKGAQADDIQIGNVSDASFARIHRSAWQEYQAGNDASQKGKWSVAHAHFANSLNLVIKDRNAHQPDIHDGTWISRCYGLIGLCLAEQNRYKDAEDHLAEAIRLDQYVADNIVVQSNVCFATNQERKAKLWLQKLRTGEYLYLYPAWAKARKLCQLPK